MPKDPIIPNTIQSALDHIYVSENMIGKTKCEKLELSSTDHVPILAKITSKGRKVKTESTKIQKRSMKNFNHESWTQCLFLT